MLSKIDAYVNIVFTLFAGAVFFIGDLEDSFYPAIITFYLGFYQLLSALIRTVYQMVRKHPYAKFLAMYWLYVGVYLFFLIGIAVEVEGKPILVPAYVAALGYAYLTYQMQKVSEREIFDLQKG